MNNNTPTYFFKYKSINTEQDISRLRDIFENNHIYMPTVDQLNDPFEGSTMKGPVGYAGISIVAAMDIDDWFTKEIKGNYCVLALSSIFYSPQMWAYYCGDYSGICLCFKNNGSFDEAKKVEYVKSLSEDYIPFSVIENQELIDEIKKQLFCKHFGWQEEYEWRIVKEKTADKNYLGFSNNELIGIIIGHKMREDIMNQIRRFIPDNIKSFVTYPGQRSRVLHILPYDYQIIGDGFKPPFISDINDFDDYINGKEQKEL